jgi:FkbM family methyltransferase
MTTLLEHDLRSPGLRPRVTGARRRWRRLRWSIAKRLHPDATVCLPFDDGLRIDVRRADRLGRHVYLDGYSDREHALLQHRYLRPGMCYFDVGAHVGQFTLVAAARVGRTGAVHAFEAAPVTYGQLLQNVTKNGLDWVTVTQAAVHDHAGEMQLNICSDADVAFNALGKPLRPDDAVVGVETVPTITLDEHCRAHEVGRIDLMKIDTNGAELHVLRGAPEILGRPDAPVIVAEFNDVATGDMGYTTGELKAAFADLGYDLFRLDADARGLRPEPTETTYPETVDLVAAKDADAVNAALRDGGAGRGG